MNIAALQSIGSGVQIGPVLLKKVWPFKPGDKSINGVISDSTGEIAFKVWGATPANGLAEGRLLTFASGGGPKSGITHTEYPVGSGKWAMNINGCRYEFQDGGMEPVQQAYQQPVQPTHAYPTQPLKVADDKLQPTMARAALATRIYVEELTTQGFTRDEALMLSANSGIIFPNFWFGEKGLG